MSLILFLAVLSTLVVVHEWGHYFVAKRLGIGVERFSIGFGPILVRKTWGGTEFCISIMPFGGYVKLMGEDPKAATGKPEEYSSRPAYQRFLVVFAGPFLNAILAFVLFSGIYIAGFPTSSTQIGKVLESSPAKEAGLLEGDRIRTANGKEVKIWEDLLMILDTSGTQTINLEVERGGETLSVSVQPKVQEIVNLFGKKQIVARMGVMPSGEVSYVKSPVFESIYLGFKKVVDLTGLILGSLAMIFSGQTSFRDSMTGPIGIYFMTEQAAKVGLIYLLYFSASLSVSLFVLNLLPIPVLDGGHLFFIVLESIFRKPISEKIKELSVQVGLYFLLAVAGLVIYQDLIKYGIFDKVKSAVGF